MMRRFGGSEEVILNVQSNIASEYRSLGRIEKALSMREEIYARRLKISGKEHDETIREATCYAAALIDSMRFKGAKELMCKTLPAAQRVLGTSHDLTLRMRKLYAQVLCRDPDATLDDLREAERTLEEIEQTVRRVLGAAHPLASAIEHDLRMSRAALRARETPSPGDA